MSNVVAESGEKKYRITVNDPVLQRTKIYFTANGLAHGVHVQVGERPLDVLKREFPSQPVYLWTVE